jgi:hypothetical protein
MPRCRSVAIVAAGKSAFGASVRALQSAASLSDRVATRATVVGMAFTDDELEYLRSHPLARVATVAADGQPDVTPVALEVGASAVSTTRGGGATHASGNRCADQSDRFC